MLLGPRDCSLEIQAAQKAFVSSVSLGDSHVNATRYLFLRSVRKLQNRFNPALWQDSDKLKTDGNVWNVLANVDNADDAIPFLWTRNLSLSDTDITGASPDKSTKWVSKLSSDIKPFGAAQIVLVRKGGAMQTIRNKYLFSDEFMGGTTNDAVKILTAQGGATSGG